MARQALEASAKYISRNPDEVRRYLRGLLGFRVGVPLDAVRWLLERAERRGKIKDPVVTDMPPGLRVTATVELMKTPVRLSAVVFVDRMKISADELRLELRLEDIWTDVLGEARGPVAALLKSGALNLSKPGDIAKYLLLPEIVVESVDNRIVIDLLKDPKMAGNVRLRQALRLLTPMVTASRIGTDEDHLELGFRPLPKGPRAVASAFRKEFVGPSILRVRNLLGR